MIVMMMIVIAIIVIAVILIEGLLLVKYTANFGTFFLHKLVVYGAFFPRNFLFRSI